MTCHNDLANSHIFGIRNETDSLGDVDVPVSNDAIFIEAANAVADQVTPDQLMLGILYPPQSYILEVDIQTTARVAKLVFDAGLARVNRPKTWSPLFAGTCTSRSMPPN
jgi:hypothetical protein